MQVAMARDMLYFSGTAIGLMATGLLAGLAKTKDKRLLVPLIPLTAALAYQVDMAYYNKVSGCAPMLFVTCECG